MLSWHPFSFSISFDAYQRSRFPPGPRPPPPPNPPPPPPERCSIGFASLTVKERPSMSEPLSAVIATFASAPDDISTKPNPSDCPLNLPAIIFTEATVPFAPNKSLNRCSVGRKTLRPSQVKWFQQALLAGMSKGQFAVVTSPQRRQLVH